MQTYEYVPISWTGELPSPLYLERVYSIKRQHELGVTGSYSDAAYPESASNFVNHYMAVRAHVDLDLDPKRELAEMCQSFFGPAGPAMNRYYLSLAEATKMTFPSSGLVGFGIDGFDRLFTPAIMASAHEAMDEAIDLTSSPGIFQDRVRMVGRTQQYLEAYMEGVWRLRAGEYEHGQAAFDKAKELIVQLGDRNEIPNPDDSLRRIETARLKAVAKYAPERLGLIRDWYVLGPFDNHSHRAIVAHNAIESKNDIRWSEPVQFAKNDKREWKLYRSPEGFVDFSEAFLGKTSEHFSYAYAGIAVLNGRDRDVEFRADSFNGFQIFLNGKKVYERAGLDTDAPDKRIVSVKLPRGRNTILVKVCQAYRGPNGRWGFYFRITDTSGRAVESIRLRP